MRNALKLSTDGTLSTLDLDAPEGSLKVLQGAVGGYVEAADLTDHVTMWMNDEGKITGLPRNVAATGLYCKNLDVVDVVCGDVVFTGGTDYRGETKGLPEDIEAALRTIVTMSLVAYGS